ncbi:hypothetical protein D3C77_450940 [compost metagenome]
MLERTPIKTEAELCAAFIQSMNKQADWTCYPEAAGFDILAVHASGRQIGIEAKMTLNAKVADQILPKDYESFYGRPGPDHRLVIVGKASDASHGIGRMLGLLDVPVLRPDGSSMCAAWTTGTGCHSSSTKNTCTSSTGTRPSDAECQWWLVRIRPASPPR